MAMCKEYDCRSYRRGVPNGCLCLSNVVFTKKGMVVKCPFYKTEAQWIKEILQLQADGHPTSDVGIY